MLISAERVCGSGMSVIEPELAKHGSSCLGKSFVGTELGHCVKSKTHPRVGRERASHNVRKSHEGKVRKPNVTETQKVELSSH